MRGNPVRPIGSGRRLDVMMDISVPQVSERQCPCPRKGGVQPSGVLRDEARHSIDRHADVMLKGGAFGTLGL
jgi:hypothetical protein